MKKIRPNYKPWQNTDYIGFHKGKDNHGYYNSIGSICCNNHTSMRIPSLKSSDKIWREFYKLFPEVKEFLCGGEIWYGTFGEVKFDEKRNLYIVRKHCRCGRFRVRLLKFKKVWN